MVRQAHFLPWPLLALSHFLALCDATVPAGVGVRLFKGGAIYEGQLKEGVPHGNGSMVG